jgi:hypothetical protein
MNLVNYIDSFFREQHSSLPGCSVLRETGYSDFYNQYSDIVKIPGSKKQLSLITFGFATWRLEIIEFGQKQLDLADYNWIWRISVVIGGFQLFLADFNWNWLKTIRISRFQLFLANNSCFWPIPTVSRQKQLESADNSWNWPIPTVISQMELWLEKLWTIGYRYKIDFQANIVLT